MIMQGIVYSYNYTLKQYVIKITSVFIILICLCTILGTDSSCLSSLISGSFIFFLITVISARILLRSNKLVLFFSIVYVVKLLLGIAHYLYFVDSSYFNGNGTTFMLHDEIQAVIDFFFSAVEEKKKYGLFYIKTDGYVTHQEMLSIIAVPFNFFGVRILNIAPINSFFSILAAMNVYLVSRRNHWSIETNMLVLLVLAYFPSTLLTSYFFRDIVGMAFMSIGLALMVFARHVSAKFVCTIISILLCFLQRNGYVVLPVLILISQYTVLGKRKKMGIIPNILIVSLFILYVVIGLAYTESTDLYIQDATKWPIYLLPVKFVMGLIGPFPWTNFTSYIVNPAAAYYLSDYACGCLNMAFSYIIYINRKILFNTSELSESAIMGIILLLMGIMNTYMHMTYISIGVFFMVPWILTNVSKYEFTKIFVLSVLGLIALNVIVVIMGISGVSTSIR